MAKRPPAAQSLSAHVLLLRGINVGGKNLLPMKELVRLVSGLGGREVVTYIQSGNVVLRAEPAVAAELPARLREQLQAGFGLSVPVVMRTAEQLRQVAEGNPFLAAGDDPASLHVYFLGERPGAERVAGLDPERSPGDRFVVQGREIYLSLPSGMGRSRLTNDYFDGRLGTVSTARNWRTVLKLLELAGG
jgi:uncharacterized protein (DUF1697 family)